MGELDVMLVVGALAAYGLVSRWLEHHSVTMAMAMVVAGFLVGAEGLGVASFEAVSETTLKMTEITLALMLFWDAARIDLKALRQRVSVPARLLGIGLPFMLLIGVLPALWLMPALGLVGAALVSVMLAPTDAALGEAVVSDARVPLAVRQGLNVESGLNDGLVVPLFLVLVDLAVDPTAGRVGIVAERLAVQVGIGVLVGVIVGGVGGWLLKRAHRDRLMFGAWGQIIVVLLAYAGYEIASQSGGSGFVAAFVSGICYGAISRPERPRYLSMTGFASTLLGGVSFLLLGGVLIPLAVQHATLAMVAYVALSLLVLRPLAVAVAMTGGHASRPTVGFMGWFGPRGLATVVFALLLLNARVAGGEAIAIVATIGVTASIFAHGLTARPLAGRYAQWCSAHAADLAGGVESEDVGDVVGRTDSLQAHPSVEASPPER